jgi:hypothetical protein
MSYRVAFDDSVRTRLARLKDRVKAVGMGAELASVLSSLVNDLSEHPMDVGETMYDLHRVAMPVKVVAKDYLSAVFVVHEISQVVMVTRMRMLDGHPFPPGFEKNLNG